MAVCKGLNGIEVADLTIEGRWLDDRKVAAMTMVGRRSVDMVAGLTNTVVAGLSMRDFYAPFVVKGRRADDIVFC